MTHRISDWLGNSRYSNPGHEGEGAKSCYKKRKKKGQIPRTNEKTVSMCVQQQQKRLKRQLYV